MTKPQLAISFSAISTRASLLYTAGLTAQSPPMAVEVK
jgi:hypothetical protein